MTDAEQLKSDIERCARLLGLAPSTVGERIGQGGRFYARLCEGKRVWPETAEKARNAMADLISMRSCDPSHGGDGGNIQCRAGKTRPLADSEAK